MQTLPSRSLFRIFYPFQWIVQPSEYVWIIKPLGHVTTALLP